MVFKDSQHRDFYEQCVEKTNAHNDIYRKSLFYTLGLTAETSHNINSLYNFKERCIDFDGLFEPWQTSTSINVTRLAFNLYNGFTGDIDEHTADDRSQYSPDNLLGNQFMPYYFEALKIRYPEYQYEIGNPKKDFQFLINGHSNKVFVFESQVDALSHAVCYKIQGMDWKKDSRVSMNKFNSIILDDFLKKNNNINTIEFCFNNNEKSRGIAMAFGEFYQNKGYTVYVAPENQGNLNNDILSVMSRGDSELSM